MPNQKIDFIRVRQYIVDQIMTSETKPVHFPPTRKLAEMFQVSQPTALRAVKDLIRDGYLLPCRGGGSVSTAWSGGPAYQLFGLVTVSGQQSMDDYFINRLYSAMALEITGRDPFYETEEIHLSSLQLLKQECDVHNFAGIVLILPSPRLLEYGVALKKNGLPVISLLGRSEGVPCVYFDWKERFLRVLNTLLEEGRKKILVSIGREMSVEMRLAARDFCNSKGISESQIVFLEFREQEAFNALKQAMELGVHFDGIVYFKFHYHLFRFLQERPEYAADTRMVCMDSDAVWMRPFSGFRIENDYESAARTLTDALIAQMNGESICFSEPMKYKLVLCGES